MRSRGKFEFLPELRGPVSQTKSVTYAKCGFWAYDVALGVLIKFLIDAAQESDDANSSWLSEAIADWRVSAAIQDLGFTLDENWSADQRKAFVALMEKACTALESRKSISADEIVSWPILDGERIFPRGAKEVLTAPVVELGRAVIALALGELPEAPKGEAWLFGTHDGRSTIRMNASWDGQW